MLGLLAPSAAADAHSVATGISARGPRPAASAAEARAHRRMRRIFAGAGLRVAVQQFAVPGLGRSRNVIGIVDAPREERSPGVGRASTAPRRPTCLRIVMAHTDSAPGAPGANDNASGLGVLAALAGRMSRIHARCDVWLAATGAEERLYTGSPDHLGALALARRARSHGARRRLRFALSLDEVGRDRPFWLRSPVPGPRPGVEGAILRAARQTRVPVSWVRDEGSGNSDHREFELLGLPGAKLGVGAGGEPCRHTPCDRPVRLDRTSLRLARRMVERALQAP